MGLGGKLIIDLGLVQRNDYYTDLIFQGYTTGSGEAVLSGGRYDNLLREFGAPMPAVGFALNVDVLTKIALSIQEPVLPSADVLVHGLDGYETAAFAHFSALLHEGFVCEHSVFETETQATEYARKKDISRIDVVSDTISVINLK